MLLRVNDEPMSAGELRISLVTARRAFPFHLKHTRSRPDPKAGCKGNTVGSQDLHRLMLRL